MGKWISHNGYHIEVTYNSMGICLTSYSPYYWKVYNGYEWDEMLERFTNELEKI